MSRTGGAQTQAHILRAARALVSTAGVAALTLDAVADEVGLTKQAILYHFGSKRGLLLGLFVGELQQQDRVLCSSIEGASSAPEAITAFMTAAVDFYLEDLGRFRILYVVNQLAREESTLEQSERQQQVYPLTSRIYASLERVIAADPNTTSDVDARRTAVSVHFAALGIACYMAMLDAAGDTLKHDPRTLAKELAHHIGRGITR
jgi:AcrR family transcriptional regulator